MVMLEKVLNNLGLGKKEQAVYKLILEHGKIAPALIARFAKINRTTVYSVAKELKEKGLIVEDLGGRTLYYLPSQSNELERLIEEENKKIKNKVTYIKELQEILKNTPASKTYSVPKIRFVDEMDLEKYLYEASPRWIENQVSGNNTTWWGFQDHTFVKNYERWIVWFWKTAPKQIDLNLFSNKSEIEVRMRGKKINRRKIKFWSKKNDFTGTQWVVGEYIILIVTAQRPHYLVEIKDAVMANNMRELFKNVWEEAK